MQAESPDTLELVRQASQGDGRVLGELLSCHQSRLQRMVRLRLDRRLRGRIDEADIVQEAYLEAARRLPDYVRDPNMPFFLWLRFLTEQQLAIVHRRHLGTQARDAARDVSLFAAPLPHATSAALAAGLIGKLTSPSNAAVRAEVKLRLREAINALEPFDREVLALRHFEQLSNTETAALLDISPTAACNRYVRALERLKAILATSL